MNFVLKPWQLLLLILAGWINRHQQSAIEYLLTENKVLREKLGKRRILLNDTQRRRLAVKGKVLGRKSLDRLAQIVRLDTLLRWHPGTESSLLASGIIQTSGNPSVDSRSLISLYAWLERTQLGATIASRVPCPMLAFTALTPLSAISSEHMVSNQRPIGSIALHGGPS